MISSKVLCPLCEEGHLVDLRYSDIVEIRGADTEVKGLHASRCDTCNEVSTSFAQLKINNGIFAAAKASVVEAERHSSGLLLGHEVKEVREILGLTQHEAAKVFGGGPTAFSKYERADGKQSEIMDRLLRLSIAVPDAAAWLLQRAGVHEYAPDRRGGLGDPWAMEWHNVATIATCLSPHAPLGCTAVPPLEEELFDSPSWKDVPLAACAGWR